MTTIVGVLNKRAVAIAADSAVTVGDTHKVMNTGNKVFTLSKHAPVGIAIYGDASLMETPWEVIIKCYRRELKTTKFQYLREYVEDFLKYLRTNEFFASSELQLRHLSYQMNSFLAICEKEATKRANYATDKIQAVLDELAECKKLNQANTDIFEDFKNYSFADFKNFASNKIIEVLKQSTILDESQHFDAFAESFFYYLRVANIIRNEESGLVFVGYGEKEIYPCLHNIVVTLGFEHKLQYRYGLDPREITNDKTTASIIPFAQVETTQTVIKGINPTFYQIISKNFTSVLDSFKKLIGNVLRTNGQNTLALQVEGIDTTVLTQTFTTATQKEFKNNYTQPLVNTIDHLGISDMANVAESLVALTSLVHRMSPKEESVGGPVDVAVISKGDGFIWIKRKHYFKPELNSQFFNNYNDD